jgi:hypothetical protein
MLFVKRFSAYVKLPERQETVSKNPHVIREMLHCLRKLPERQDTE